MITARVYDAVRVCDPLTRRRVHSLFRLSASRRLCAVGAAKQTGEQKHTTLAFEHHAVPEGPTASAANYETHNQHQCQTSNAQVEALVIEGQRLRSVVESARDCLGPSARVLDMGSGTGCLIPHLQAAGVRDILAADVSSEMLAALRQRFPDDPGPLGNSKGLRTWLGDIASLPAYQAPFDAIFYNACFGNVLDQWQELLNASLLSKSGTCIVISHPEVRSWHTNLQSQVPDTAPNAPPDEERLQQLIATLPLKLTAFRDDELYLARLEVDYRIQPRSMRGRVVSGFGRGSREMAVPTANLDPGDVSEQVAGLCRGVYFGWAQLEREGEQQVHKMVMNIGKRPTCDDGGGETIEVHVLARYPSDFYGETMRAVAVGFIRPEMRFAGLQALVARIKADIGTAKAQLDDPALSQLCMDAFFQSGRP